MATYWITNFVTLETFLNKWSTDFCLMSRSLQQKCLIQGQIRDQSSALWCSENRELQYKWNPLPAAKNLHLVSGFDIFRCYISSVFKRDIRYIRYLWYIFTLDTFRMFLHWEWLNLKCLNRYNWTEKFAKLLYQVKPTTRNHQKLDLWG